MALLPRPRPLGNRPTPPPGPPQSQHKVRTIKLLAISSRLQSMMINEGITPDELVACAMSVKAGYDSVDMKSHFNPQPFKQ